MDYVFLKKPQRNLSENESVLCCVDVRRGKAMAKQYNSAGTPLNGGNKFLVLQQTLKKIKSENLNTTAIASHETVTKRYRDGWPGQHSYTPEGTVAVVFGSGALAESQVDSGRRFFYQIRSQVC